MEFDKSEYEFRVGRITAEMKVAGMDALVVTGDLTGGLNYRYLSGHSPRDFQMQIGRPHVLVLTQDGRAGIIAYTSTAANAEADSWVSDIRSYREPFDIRQLRDLFVDLGLSDARIGYEMGTSQRCTIPLNDFLALSRLLPGSQQADATEILEKVRTVKSAAEVGSVLEASKINQAALDYGFGQLQHCTSALDVYKAVMVGLVQNGAHRPPVAQIMSTSSAVFRKGIGHRARLGTPSTDPLLEGDIVFVDPGCSVNGYWCEYNRSGVLGTPNAEQFETNRICRELVQETVEKTVRAGARASTMVEHLIKIYRRYRIDESEYREFLEPPFGNLVHGMGLTSSEPPFIGTESHFELKAGMVLSVEAKVGRKSFKYASEDAVLVTDSGFEWLSGPDHGLYSTSGVAHG